MPRLNGDSQTSSWGFNAAESASGGLGRTPCREKPQTQTDESCELLPPTFAEARPNVTGSSSTKQSSSSRACNNHAGRPTKADMVRATGLSAAQSVLSFDCPRLCHRRCEGLYMGCDEQAAKPAQAAAIVASVRALRERLSLNSKGTQLKHALVQEMASLVSGYPEAPAVKAFPCSGWPLSVPVVLCSCSSYAHEAFSARQQRTQGEGLDGRGNEAVQTASWCRSRCCFKQPG